MKPLALALGILAIAAPLVVFALIARRPRKEDDSGKRRARLALAAITIALGAALYVPAWFLEGWIAGWAGLDERARTVHDVASLVYAFFVVAPLEQGAKALAVFPASRTRSFSGPRDGVLFGVAAALGFVTAHDAKLVLALGASEIDAVRVLLAAPAHAFFGAAWGYVLGREAKEGKHRGLGGNAFKITWLLATLFNGVYDQIVFARGSTSLITAAPILLVMLVIAIVAQRSLDGGVDARVRPRRLVIAPPTLGAVRAALWRTEQPVMVGWIGAGALVTVGVITSALAGAVVLGRRIGVDFSAVDRGEGAAGVAPLVLLGGATLAAFPIAGYLVARASSSRGVLEAAIAAALAIIGGLVLLGLAAPVAVVFALAFAPIALGLACAGAWVGITRS